MFIILYFSGGDGHRPCGVEIIHKLFVVKYTGLMKKRLFDLWLLWLYYIIKQSKQRGTE